jgi:hypothetical protein
MTKLARDLEPGDVVVLPTRTGLGIRKTLERAVTKLDPADQKAHVVWLTWEEGGWPRVAEPEAEFTLAEELKYRSDFGG